MLSTNNCTQLPTRNRLKDICKSVSVADAIFSEDWLDRYYTFNSKWAQNEEFAGMRNGQGDDLLILFRSDGCVINGMAHEYFPKDKVKLTQGLPKIYDEFIFGEPVNSIGTTFCIWTSKEDTWQIGQVDSSEDGSKEMLGIFDDNYLTYVEWAIDYYELDIENRTNLSSAILKIYNGEILTKEMVYKVSSQFKHWRQLIEDLGEIGYPYNFD